MYIFQPIRNLNCPLNPSKNSRFDTDSQIKNLEIHLTSVKFFPPTQASMEKILLLSVLTSFPLREDHLSSQKQLNFLLTKAKTSPHHKLQKQTQIQIGFSQDPKHLYATPRNKKLYFNQKIMIILTSNYQLVEKENDVGEKSYRFGSCKNAVAIAKRTDLEYYRPQSEL